MKEAPRPVLSIGEILIDLIATDDATRLEDVTALAVRPGGAPANAAVALARQGIAAAFCGVVGDDPFGSSLRSTLRTNDVDDSRLRAASGVPTTIALAWKDERGDGNFQLVRLADRLLNRDDVERAAIGETGAIIVGSVSLSEEPSRTAIQTAVVLARNAGVPICFDVNMRPTIWSDPGLARELCEPILAAATVIKLSLDDARALLGTEEPSAVFTALEAYPAPFIVLTDGERGSWFAVHGDGNREDPVFQPVFAVDAIDPTGAGDAFNAALIGRLIGHGWATLGRDDVRYASAAGALATTRRGGMDSLPSADEISAFAASRSLAGE